jgi:hypothetical protein
MTTIIDIQQAYIDRLLRAYAKIGPRSCGARFARSKRAARNEAIRAFTKLGFNETETRQLVVDAYDMFILERDAR